MLSHGVDNRNIFALNSLILIAGGVDYVISYDV